MSGRTLTPLAHRTPEKVENFQKSNLGIRMLLSHLLDFRKARRTEHGAPFAFASYLPRVCIPTTNAITRKAAVMLHLPHDSNKRRSC